MSEESGKPESGFLVHLFVGDQNSAEFAVLRKICMKFGLTSWDVMSSYLPWRNRAALRTTMCRVIRKQALSEYEKIRADPLEIQKDNDEIIKQVNKGLNKEYLLKGGVLVNAKWDRSPEEWNRIREEHKEKYTISNSVAESIYIPSVMSVDYMRQQCFKRRQSLLLYRAALLAERAKRRGETHVDLGVDELTIRPGTDIVTPKNAEKLTVETKAESLFFKVEDGSM